MKYNIMYMHISVKRYVYNYVILINVQGSLFDRSSMRVRLRSFCFLFILKGNLFYLVKIVYARC